jgi:hypothetical protein
MHMDNSCCWHRSYGPNHSRGLDRAGRPVPGLYHAGAFSVVRHVRQQIFLEILKRRGAAR